MGHSFSFRAIVEKSSLRTKFSKFSWRLSGQTCLGLGADPVSPMPRLAAVPLLIRFILQRL